MKRMTIAISILSMASSQAFALPWHPKEMSQQRHHKTLKTDTADFSGVWHGQCNNQPVADLVIQHSSDSITLKYSGIQESYTIGEVNSSTSGKHNKTTVDSSSASWNTLKNVLTFINTTQYQNEHNSVHSFFSKVSMFLNGMQLNVEGEYYQTSGNIGDIKKEKIVCRYLLNQ